VHPVCGCVTDNFLTGSGNVLKHKTTTAMKELQTSPLALLRVQHNPQKAHWAIVRHRTFFCGFTLNGTVGLRGHPAVD
jgi:hypothetical protein